MGSTRHLAAAASVSPIASCICRLTANSPSIRRQRASDPAFDSYVADPANPVPYRPRPIRLNAGWSTWLVEDQRFVHRRPDVLDWVSEPLTSDLTISGKIVAHLFASSSGTDSDWIVKLIDVYPEKYAADPEMGGYQLMIAGDVFRARYRHSFEKPEPLTPGCGRALSD